MNKIWIIAITVFIVTNVLFWFFTSGYFRKLYGKKSWNHWGTQTYYWQGSIFVSTGLTLLIILILRWGNIFSL